jgi:two-component sensor histidine kinase
MDEKFHWLRNVQFFKSLPDSDIIKIQEVCQERRFNAGEVIFFEGSLGDNFFIILEGTVEICKGYRGPDHGSLAVYGQGQLFGELALIDDFPRSATVVTREPATLLCINRDDFNQVITQSNSISLSIMKSLAATIRESTDNFLEDLRARNRHLEEAYQQLKASEARIAASLREKEVLLYEIHHRVKNNMQIITSLLSLQARQLKDDAMSQVFRTTRNRIRAMSLIHETLFQSSDLSRLNAGDYISKLVRVLFRTLGSGDGRVIWSAAADGIFLSLDDAVPVGLIINELVSNSIRHGFPPGCGGEISVSMRKREDDQIELSVMDNGKGFPRSVNFQTTPTLGLTLVRGLVEEQLEGRLMLNSSGGTRFTIRFSQKKR